MYTCRYCGRAAPAGRMSHVGCGAEHYDRFAKHTCTKCGKADAVDGVFCPDCGADGAPYLGYPGN